MTKEDRRSNYNFFSKKINNIIKKNKKNNKKQKELFVAGCDISAEKIDIFLMNKIEEGIHKIFSNDLFYLLFPKFLC